MTYPHQLATTFHLQSTPASEVWRKQYYLFSSNCDLSLWESTQSVWLRTHGWCCVHTVLCTKPTSPKWNKNSTVSTTHIPIPNIPNTKKRKKKTSNNQKKKQLTDSKFSLMWRPFNLILNKASVETSVTFLHMLNAKGAGIVSPTVLEPRFIRVNIFAISLPQELQIISSGFNSKGYRCSSCYWLPFWMSSDLRGINCGERVDS